MSIKNDLTKNPPSSILLINIRLIGDVILSTPLIGALKERWPHSKIHCLVNRGTGEWLEKDPRVEKVIYHEPKEKGLTREKGGSYFKAIFRSYDVAIDLNGSDRGALASILAGRNMRIGFVRKHYFWSSLWKRILLTHPIDYSWKSHVVEMSRKVMEALGVAASQLKVDLFWDQSDEDIVLKEISSMSIKAYVVLHPFPRWSFKEVPLDVLANGTVAIARSMGFNVVVTSGPDEREKEKLETMVFPDDVRVVKIPGTLNLNQIACLINGAQLYIGLDTAVTHIAASTGTPVVALYGPTPLWRWGPWCNTCESPQYPMKGNTRNGHIVVIQRDWECVSCGRKGCDDSMTSRCLEDISSEEIVEASSLVMEN
jgi:heptosyltransferase-3